MGGRSSKYAIYWWQSHMKPTNLDSDIENGSKDEKDFLPGFTKYTFEQLKVATSGFSAATANIVSAQGEKAPNLVYKGKLDNDRFIAIKRSNKSDSATSLS